MGFLSNLFGGKKLPAPPVADLGKVRDASLKNAERSQRLYGQVAQYLDDYLAKHPQFQDELSGLFAQSYNRLKDRAGFAAELESLGNEGQLKAIRRLVEFGGGADQQRAAQRATAAFDSEFDRSQRERQFREGIYGTSDRIGRDSAVAEALARSQVDYNAREQARTQGDALRMQYLPTLAAAGGAQEANLQAQRAATAGRQGAQQGKFIAPVELAGSLANYGNQVSSDWNDFSNSAMNQWQAQVQKAKADNARKSSIFGAIGRIGGTIAGAAIGGPAGAAIGGSIGGALGGGGNSGGGFNPLSVMTSAFSGAPPYQGGMAADGGSFGNQGGFYQLTLPQHTGGINSHPGTSGFPPRSDWWTPVIQG